jgi:hypothetical protein
MARYYKKSSELLDKYDSYMVTGKKDSRGFTPAANLEVTSTRERNFPNFDFREPDPDNFYSRHTKSTGWSPQYISDQVLNHFDNPLNNGKDFYIESDIPTPTELFTTEPRKTTITSAVFDPSLKHAMPIVGAMVHQEHGIPITADESLSTASSKLARNAQKKGLPVIGHEGNPTFKQNNYASGGDFYFSDQEEQDEVMDGFVEIHPDKVREAKNHLRGLLGREPKQHMSQQFKDVPLPGMENY